MLTFGAEWDEEKRYVGRKTSRTVNPHGEVGRCGNDHSFTLGTWGTVVIGDSEKYSGKK